MPGGPSKEVIMNQPVGGPIAFTVDGQPIFAAPIVPLGSAQPIGVFGNGEPVWAVAPGNVPPGSARPYGITSAGAAVWAKPVPGLDSRSIWQKKRVLIPAGVFMLFVFAAAAGGNDSQPTEVQQAAGSSEVEETEPPVDPAQAAAEKAAEEQAAAEKAAAEKAAAEQAAAQAAAEAAAAEQAAAEKAAAEKAALDNAQPLSARDFALLVKDPDSHKGKVFRVFGEVNQFDAATGDKQFLASSGAAKSAIEYGFTEYDQNTLFTGSAQQLASIVEGDVFSAVVEVSGTESYDTQIGGNTTVPKFKVLAIEVYGSTL